MIDFIAFSINAFAYMLPLLIILPFKITFRQKIILYIILLSNIFLMVYIVGNIGVVILLITVSIYISILDRNHLRNICFFIITYLLCVVSDYSLSLFCNIIGYKLDTLRNSILLTISYNIIYIILLCIICKIIKHAILYKFNEKEDYAFPKEVSILIIANIFTCLFIFIFNIVTGEYIGYSPRVIMFNCILFGFYFLISTIMIINSIKTYITKNEMRMKQDSFDTLQKYTAQIESMYSEIRSFKHDYINIMSSMSGYIEANDMKGLSDYFSEKIAPLNTLMNKSDYKLNQLMNIKILEIKSLVSAKVIYANEIGIDVNIEIIHPIEKINMDVIDFSRILGIFLDNAIEASLEAECPWISFVMISDQDSVTILISNNHINYNIPFYELKKANISTKGKNRGIGLSNAYSMISGYSNVLLDTQIKEDLFIQCLEINNF